METDAPVDKGKEAAKGEKREKGRRKSRDARGGEAAGKEKGSKERERARPEPGSYKLENPARVVPAQQRFVSFDPQARWRPLREGQPAAGIVVLKDHHPGAISIISGYGDLVGSKPYFCATD